MAEPCSQVEKIATLKTELAGEITSRRDRDKTLAETLAELKTTVEDFRKNGWTGDIRGIRDAVAEMRTENERAHGQLMSGMAREIARAVASERLEREQAIEKERATRRKDVGSIWSRIWTIVLPTMTGIAAAAATVAYFLSNKG